jgi:ergothioneine biosynthesis protein EgtB
VIRSIRTDQAAGRDSSKSRLLLSRYNKVRQFTEELCAPLATEDYVIQSMPDVSPTKWHLAHTSWFFETFVLTAALSGYRSPDPQYGYLFNSYYNSAGERHCRNRRGLLSRPTVEEIYRYRSYVDDRMREFLDRTEDDRLRDLAFVIELGLNHEQQHQELLLTDIKHIFSINPLRPVYCVRENSNGGVLPKLQWLEYTEGLHRLGHNVDGFAFDNELPQHRVFLEPFQFASRLVTSGEYLDFIEDGGYENPLIWLSDGWNVVQTQGWKAPLYWEKRDGSWWIMTLSGMRELDRGEPVCHVSYYEADAYACWAGARLPAEAEWEIVSAGATIDGNFVESRKFHPVPIADSAESTPVQMFGDVWEWTQSHYSPYPGYRPVAGALGEYNGKFMCNQFVLRGGSCATSITHIRPTYRNFFPADARWQFMGIRLAKKARG